MSAAPLVKACDKNHVCADDYIIASHEVLAAAHKAQTMIGDFRRCVNDDLSDFFAALPPRLSSGPFRVAADEGLGLYLKKLQIIGGDYDPRAVCSEGGLFRLAGKTAPLITTPQMAVRRKESLTQENLLTLKEIAGQFNDRVRQITRAQIRQLDAFDARTRALGFGYYDYLRQKETCGAKP